MDEDFPVFVDIIDQVQFQFKVYRHLKHEQILYKAKYHAINHFHSLNLQNIKFQSYEMYQNCIKITGIPKQLYIQHMQAIDYPPFFDDNLKDIYARPYLPDPDDLTLFQGDFQIILSQINTLILHVINPYSARIIKPAFLLYFPKWLSPTKLLEKVISIFNIPSPVKQPTDDPNYLESYELTIQIPVQMSILTFLQTWLTFYFDDFTQELVDIIINFLNTLKCEFLVEITRQVYQAIIQQQSHRYEIAEFSFKITDNKPFRIVPGANSLYLGGDAAPKLLHTQNVQFKYKNHFRFNLPFFSKLNDTKNNQKLQEQSPICLATHFFLFLYETYANIHPRDFIDNSPILLLHIKRFNVISAFVSQLLIASDNFTFLVEKFIKTSEILLGFNGFEPAIAILTAILNTPVSRIIGDQPYVTGLLTQFGIDQNWRGYRQKIQEISSVQTCLPLLSIARKDAFISEESGDRMEKGRCNIGLAVNIFNAIHRYIRFQYQKIQVNQFQEFSSVQYIELIQYELISDDDLWELSYQALPRGG
ncbi:Ras guanine nucleotide exchange factor [Spironucleus salmonicida]|uniref:Ras guanine nucleotide exchange factor n=1 Tax=Spironucleus salmonicida TaxID=348837 RepID=V6M5B1_9EUKA|nr:Ras guanine nucleotide exchange factor [Spironucleus salmonicida]|eukprot:EST48544.1 Ras guanine nucleotide exchange factor [Spironucleus salmonicida]